jgi:hypothetical protein
MYKNAYVFWHMGLFSPFMNRPFRGIYHRHLQGRKSAEQETSMLESDWTELLTRRYITEDGNILKYRRENLKSHLVHSSRLGKDALRTNEGKQN